jgi:hypothetical protein
MMKFGVLSVCLLALHAVAGQVSVTPDRVDFGIIVRETDRVRDFIFTNDGPGKAVFLRSDFTAEYQILYSAKEMAPGESMTLRVKHNPRKKGNTAEQFRIWFSNMQTPVALSFSARTEYIDNTDNPACPSFNERPAGCCDGNDITIEVRNALTEEPISGARVRLFLNGRKVLTAKTDKNGQTIGEYPVNYYFIPADKEGFLPADTAMYLNRRNNFVVLRLMPEIIPAPETPDLIAEKKMETPAVPEVLKNPHTTEEDPGLREELPDFSEKLYRPNHVIFLLDVSGSMKQKGRMELLKTAMVELYGMLREVDRVSIVTFASRTDVIHENVRGSEKSALENGLSQLEADGMTMSLKGFKMAYQLAERHKIIGGNNEIIVVSDGAFQVKDKQLLIDLSTKYAEKGISTSLLGIRSTPAAAAILTQIAEACGGSFTPLNDAETAEKVLVEEVKSKSRIQ